MGEADPLLSSLCAICHVHPHVYKCPRCAVLTCSLNCVQRHKKWAQCNGVRNPAAYIPISDLATPAGIDKDYNYLTSLERQLDNAERDASNRGIQLADEILDKAKMKKGVQSLQAGLEKSRAIIIKAPKGMSREKTNTTRWLKGSQRLEWTVEWVHEDGRKELGQCVETEPISKIYEIIREMKEGKKRKNHKGQAQEAKRLQQQMPSKDHENEIIKDQLAVSSKARTGVQSDSVGTASNHDQDLTHQPPESNASSASSFFLHAPSLPTRKTVLIPLPDDATLRSSLRERVVLEYPTIYAMHQEPDRPLPEAFMLEDDYLKTARKGPVQELEDGEIEQPGAKNRADQKADLGKLDEKKLLEVLGKDLGMSK